MNNEPIYNKFKEFVSHNLNKSQQEAVLNPSGPTLVIAGAGSGKTRVITARIIYLMLERKIAPTHIVALTFTNKAAQEMKDRIQSFLQVSPTTLPFIGTFHGYCLRLLKTEYARQGLQPFTILDDDDQQKMIRDLLVRLTLHKHLSAKQVSSSIALLNNAADQEHQAQIFSAFHPLIKDVILAYEAEKQASRCFDFDDLLTQTVKLFKTNDVFAQRFRANLHHILIDEYQDTNAIQHALLVAMTTEEKKITAHSICAVGDEDQSIYSWRGATVANILNFTADFPRSTIIKIEQNYRSVQPILEVANQVISHNIHRNPKTLWSSKQATQRVTMLQCLSDYQETDVILEAINAYRTHNPTQSIAILYRTHAQSRVIEEGFVKRALPYKVIGNTQFYARKEIKDLLAYLKLIINPFDRSSFFRILNTPTRGLGDKVEEACYTALANEPFLSCIAVLQRMIKEQIFPKQKTARMHELTDLFASLTLETPAITALQLIIEKTAYVSYIKDNYEQEDAQSRIENINELVRAVAHAQATKEATISSFLEDVTLMQELLQQDHAHNPVLIMTLHSAKGLEFDFVTITGCEDGILPSLRSLYDTDALEEERRLLYVGVTRAGEYLMLTHARSRCTYGQIADQRPSRFLAEIPPALVYQADTTYWRSPDMADFFTKWFTQGTFGTSRTTSSPAIKKAIPEKLPKKLTSSGFKKFQTVQHAQYGMGIIQALEEKDMDMWYATVKFKTGTKKIMTKFLQSI